MRAAFLALLLVPLVSPAAAATPTGGEVAARLLDELLAPVVSHVQGEGYPPRIALFARDFAQEGLESSVAGFFLDQGFAVWVLEEDDLWPEEPVVALDFSLEQATITYPRSDDGMLGLGARRLLRRASATMTGTLNDPFTGRRLWQGSPEARYEDWIEASQQAALAADRPRWLTENQAEGLGASQAGWKEKAVVLGLLGGVIILYFSGAN